MATDGFTIIKLLLSAANVAKAVVNKALKALEEPLTASAEDRRILAAYCKDLDERRALFAPYHMEVAGAVMSSLNTVRERTREARVAVENAVAVAYLEAILDHLRRFIDKWEVQLRDRGEQYPRQPRDQELVEFCVDLGSLREAIRTFVALMAQIDKKAVAPNLFAEDGT